MEFPAHFFVTANFNLEGLSFASGKRKLRHFHAVLDRHFLGNGWLASRQRPYRSSPFQRARAANCITTCF
jgi:hypothetical protein